MLERVLSKKKINVSLPPFDNSPLFHPANLLSVVSNTPFQIVVACNAPLREAPNTSYVNPPLDNQKRWPANQYPAPPELEQFQTSINLSLTQKQLQNKRKDSVSCKVAPHSHHKKSAYQTRIVHRTHRKTSNQHPNFRFHQHSTQSLHDDNKQQRRMQIPLANSPRTTDC
jgi:hypothetical protein